MVDTEANESLTGQSYSGREDILPEPKPRCGPDSMQRYHGEHYYGIPPIKHSHYKWKTSAAFLCNGIGGGSQVLAAIMDLFGREEDRALVRVGRYMALAGGSISPALLIAALHKKQRWYNMLRMFKRTSPMSIGIWAITPFSICSGFTAVGQLLEDLGYQKSGRRMSSAFSLPAALLGGIVTSYMGTELEETCMPVWASAHPYMAPLYAAAGASNAAAVLQIAATANNTSTETRRRLNYYAIAAETAELALCTMIEGRWRKLPENRFYRRSSFAPWFRYGVIGLGSLAPLAIKLLPAGGNGQSSQRSMLAAAAKLAGGAILQTVMVYAGKESGQHAQEYFEHTRPETLATGKSQRNALIRAGFSSRPAAPATAAGRIVKRRPVRRGGISSMLGMGFLAAGAALLISAAGAKQRPNSGD
jgi:protein NrfD